VTLAKAGSIEDGELRTFTWCDVQLAGWPIAAVGEK
jgi:hypothetical protein